MHFHNSVELVGVAQQTTLKEVPLPDQRQGIRKDASEALLLGSWEMAKLRRKEAAEPVVWTVEETQTTNHTSALVLSLTPSHPSGSSFLLCSYLELGFLMN